MDEIVSVNGTSVPAYEAVCRIVAKEMGTSFHTEAYKAQAVAVYTLIREGDGSISGVNMVPMSSVSSKVKSAVEAVWGETITYNGDYIHPFYCSMTAGRTNTPEDVWGGSYPYYESVDCEWDTQVAGFETNKSISQSSVISTVKSKLGIELDPDDPEGWFEVLDYTSGGYNGDMLVGGYDTAPGGTYSGRTITGRLLRESVFSLRSAAFDRQVSGSSILFTTYGYGHGVGMSQHAANLMGREGWTYDEILTYFYVGTDVG